jgi:hypothetical protein
MLRILRQLGRADGTEIAEAAVVLPLLFTFLLGIVWFGRAFQVYSTITQAAQRGAVTAARASCATCPLPADNWSGTNFPGDTTVNNAVYAITDASNLDEALITQNPPSTPFPACPLPAPAPACSPIGNPITICRSVKLNANSTPAQCGVVVTFKYPFQLYLPFTSLNLQQVMLTAQAQTRMEN